MGKSKRHAPDKHKQSLGDELEDPATYGVKVTRGVCAATTRPQRHVCCTNQQHA